MKNIRSYKELRVYQAAMEAAMKIFELTKRFPSEKKLFDRSDSTFLSLRLHKYCGSLAKAAVSCPFR
jgi:hypothetical protein